MQGNARITAFKWGHGTENAARVRREVCSHVEQVSESATVVCPAPQPFAIDSHKGCALARARRVRRQSRNNRVSVVVQGAFQRVAREVYAVE